MMLDQAGKVLTGAGLTELGRGAYSIVLGLPDPTKVVKVSPAGQDGYHHFVRALPSLSNPIWDHHLPKVYLTEVIGGVRFTVMERLSHFNANGLESLEDWPASLNALREYLETVRPEGVCDDCTGNVMFRGDTAVITDPWGTDAGG